MTRATQDQKRPSHYEGWALHRTPASTASQPGQRRYGAHEHCRTAPPTPEEVKLYEPWHLQRLPSNLV